MGYDYYPVSLGSWFVYSVDSTVYDDNDHTVYTISYQTKEIYADTFTDNEGRLSYKIERYKREGDSSLWAISDIWYLTKTATHVEKIEEDVRYESFIFPPQNNMEWDLNSYNNFSIYSILERKKTYNDDSDISIDVKDTLVDKMFDLDSLTSYNNTVTVWHEFLTQINDEQYQAVYAKDIGLVYKQMIYFYSDTVYNVPIAERVTYGVRCTQKLISYGD